MKIPKIKKWQKVEILWEDSSHTGGWTKEDDFKEDYLEHLTCGYFLQETPRTIQIIQSKATSKDKDGKVNVDAMMQIPKKAVLKIRKLK